MANGSGFDFGTPFKDRVALVSGGSRGIGAATAERLAARGASVALTYRTNAAAAEAVVKRIRENDRRAVAIQADQAVHEDVKRAFETTVRELGKPDILVVNAGITRDRSLKRMSLEEWNEVIAVNLTGAFHFCRLGLEYMPMGPRTRIILISSIIGRTGSFGQVNYAAAKAGIIGFAHAMAREVARTGATVNALAPGFIDTDMVAGMPDEVLDQVKRQIPLGRLGRPEEVAHAVSFLAHPDSGFVTGAVLDVNGGQWM
jgi:NAD(P)-dependent dehydrogenase (short-subunit alcohol dehydrogenase family)